MYFEEGGESEWLYEWGLKMMGKQILVNFHLLFVEENLFSLLFRSTIAWDEG